MMLTTYPTLTLLRLVLELRSIFLLIVIPLVAESFVITGTKELNTILAQQQAQLSELERESKVPKQFQSLQKAVKSLIDLHQN